MFNIKQNSKIYIFDFHRNAYIKIFEDEEELINFIGHSAKYDEYTGNLDSPYFENVNMNGNDIMLSYDFDNMKNTYYRRQYMFIKEDNTIVDIRNYKEEIINRIIHGEIFYVRYKRETLNDVEYGDVCSRSNNTFRYRIDPVPYSGRHSRYGKYLRHMKTFNEMKQNSDVDAINYVRPKRKHLPTVYDDVERHIEKSWKRQSKKRKQWM